MEIMQKSKSRQRRPSWGVERGGSWDGGGAGCYILLNSRDWLVDELRTANTAVSIPRYQSSGQLLKLLTCCEMGKKQGENESILHR